MQPDDHHGVNWLISVLFSISVLAPQQWQTAYTILGALDDFVSLGVSIWAPVRAIYAHLVGFPCISEDLPSVAFVSGIVIHISRLIHICIWSSGSNVSVSFGNCTSFLVVPLTSLYAMIRYPVMSLLSILEVLRVNMSFVFTLLSKITSHRKYHVSSLLSIRSNIFYTIEAIL